MGWVGYVFTKAFGSVEDRSRADAAAWKPRRLLPLELLLVAAALPVARISV